MIKQLKILSKASGWDAYYLSYSEDIKLAIKLAIVKLKRNIPKKVTRNNDEEIICPNCKNILHTKQFRHEFCSWCGQALDWSEIL